MYKRIQYNGKACYGKHMLVHLQNCNDNILSIEIVQDFISQLVKNIDMIPFGDCHCFRFGDGEEIGLSAIQLIYTSSITLHTNDMHREGYLDVFSCKNFSEEKVVESIKKVFSPSSSIEYETIIRE
jgi:S-adenosylmethionine/arginine decarboxylase-like enzyme